MKTIAAPRRAAFFYPWPALMHPAPINPDATRHLNGQQSFLKQAQRPQAPSF